MKRYLSFISGIFIITSLTSVHSQVLISNSSVTGVCYAGNKTNRIYIPPPDEFFKKAGSKGGAVITIIFTGFPSQAKKPVVYATSILETLLPADTRITISASWERITTAGVLGNSSVTYNVDGGSIDALNPFALYPVALAEKIAGKRLNDSLSADINLRINSSINWYLGTDGHTSNLQYDLVTVVLHEVCHGIGFFDSMSTDGSLGWYGFGSKQMIYDSFIENFQGKKLTDTLEFQNNSPELLGEFTGGNLYFNGPLLKSLPSGSRAPVYAPSTWDAGSSISHLDEELTREPNTLMTPFIDKGEAIHDPGKLTLSILGDLGWVNTRIIHKANSDTEAHLSEILLSIGVVPDTLYNHDRVGAVFSFDNFASSDTLLMTSPNSDDLFNCTVNIPSYNKELQYYFFVEDCFMRLYRSPSLFDTLRYSFFIGTDTVKPVISHTPVTSCTEKVDTIKFNAQAKDNLGIDTVFAEYKWNNGQSIFVGLQAAGDDNYSGSVNARSLFLNGGDSIQYRLFAVDTAQVPNTSVLPASGYFVIHIEALSSTLESYSTDFSGEADADFLNVGFEVSKPDGFNKYGLNSKHPYESPEDNDKSIEYTALLRHPLKFNESGMLISFNEIVLVEPGESGSVFGSPDFYDYVIVEGSKNFGRTWFSLAAGYDSRIVKSWETAYKNAIVVQNSTAVGDESMLIKHTVFYAPSDNISAGDTLLLRFRLYSDPYANGWGWVIEDLNINPLFDAVENVREDEATKVYPNPGRGLIKISSGISGSENGKPVRLNIFNTAGVCIKSNYLLRDEETEIDISDYPNGIYIIVLYKDDWVNTIKYSLIK